MLFHVASRSDSWCCFTLPVEVTVGVLRLPVEVTVGVDVVSRCQ